MARGREVFADLQPLFQPYGSTADLEFSAAVRPGVQKILCREQRREQASSSTDTPAREMEGRSEDQIELELGLAERAVEAAAAMAMNVDAEMAEKAALGLQLEEYVKGPEKSQAAAAADDDSDDHWGS